MLQVLGTSAQAGAADILTLSPDANRVTVQAGAQGSDRMLSVLKEGDTFGRQVIVSQFDLPAGGFGEIALNAEMDMITFTSSISQSAYQVVFNQVGITSTQFSAPLPPLGGGDVLSINLDWSNPTSATVEIDQGGDGTIDKTL